jgi:hypothetical protein
MVIREQQEVELFEPLVELARRCRCATFSAIPNNSRLSCPLWSALRHTNCFWRCARGTCDCIRTALNTDWDVAPKTSIRRASGCSEPKR